MILLEGVGEGREEKIAGFNCFQTGFTSSKGSMKVNDSVKIIGPFY